MKKWLLVALAAAALIGGYAYTALQNNEQPDTLTLYGNVDIRDVVLGFRIFGRLESVNFEEGDRVKTGTVLASLDKEPLIEEVELREAELKEAMVTLENASKLYQRRAKLVKSGTVSQEAYDEALAARDRAGAQVQTARVRLKKAETQLEDTEIRAPNAGTVLTRIREPGEIVSQGAPVYTLALDKPVWVRAYIDEPNLGRVHPGQKAVVANDSGNRYTGQVGFISPQAEFTPKNVETAQLRTDLVYRLRIIVDDPGEGLRQGMPVTVTLEPAGPDG